MANVRNYEEYRAEVLDTLGATVEDLRNEPSFRAKVLETLGVEFTDEDTRNFERYRLKALEGLKNGGGGGGSSDLTTATVTFNSNTDETLQLMVPVATEDGADIERAVRKGRTLEVLLYNGSCIVSPNDSFKGDFTDFSVTGDISIDTEAGYIIVSGDGTISYNAK